MYFFLSVKQNLFVSVFVDKRLMMLNDVEYTTFKMFVTQMSNYLFVISFELMFYKTLRYRSARALRNFECSESQKAKKLSVLRPDPSILWKKVCISTSDGYF